MLKLPGHYICQVIGQKMYTARSGFCSFGRMYNPDLWPEGVFLCPIMMMSVLIGAM